MTEQITLKEVLEIVTFTQWGEGDWRVKDVKKTVCGTVYGKIIGDIGGGVDGSVYGGVGGDIGGGVGGDVYGGVGGDVYGGVGGKIKGREWTFIETTSEKVQRWVDGASEEDLLKLINQLENN